VLPGLQNIMDDFICALQKKLLLQGLDLGCVRSESIHHAACCH
jgi:hypothetical protein